jgi:hypothetical protein
MLGKTRIPALKIRVFVNGTVVRTTPRLEQLEDRLSALSTLHVAEAEKLVPFKRAAAEFTLTLDGNFLKTFCIVGRTADYMFLIRRIVREFSEEVDLEAYFTELGLKETDFVPMERFGGS